jgi:hypothetical protein
MTEERTARLSAASIDRTPRSPWIGRYLHPGPGRPAPEPLSPDSAASVREGAIAVLHHGVRYLPVVDDGVLVGIVAVEELDPPCPGPDTVRP